MTSSASDAPSRPRSRESTPPTTGSTVARKVWLALNREGIAVARCTVERLMAELGLSGATRGETRKTTIADPTAVFPADHCPAPVWATGTESAVGRRPDCVSTWWGFAYVALVVDAYARRILGWRVAATMATSMVLDAIEQAIWTRQQEGVLNLKDVVHHTDRGSHLDPVHRTPRRGGHSTTGRGGRQSYDKGLAS